MNVIRIMVICRLGIYLFVVVDILADAAVGVLKEFLVKFANSLLKQIQIIMIVEVLVVKIVPAVIIVIKDVLVVEIVNHVALAKKNAAHSVNVVEIVNLVALTHKVARSVIVVMNQVVQLYIIKILKEIIMIIFKVFVNKTVHQLVRNVRAKRKSQNEMINLNY